MTDRMTPSPATDAADLTERWHRIRVGDTESLAHAAVTHQCIFPPPEAGFEEDDAYTYLPVTMVIPEGDGVRSERVLFALGQDVLLTLEPTHGFPAFDRAAAILRRRPDVPRDAHGIMYALLQATNSVSNQSIEFASEKLEAMATQIRHVTQGFDASGREMTTDDINDTMLELNAREELISRIQDTQLLMARAARYLRAEITGEQADLRGEVETLISDIHSIKEHASFEHDKVRYLLQSVTTALNAKQNQVVKVFTIITAVFLPPTLIATFYGMNFAVMPELSWAFGFPATIILTLLAALLPLWYIQRKGWLR